MPKWKVLLWTLIRKESAPDTVDWAAVLTLVLYSLLVLLLAVGFLASVCGLYYYGLPPQG